MVSLKRFLNNSKHHFYFILYFNPEENSNRTKRESISTDAELVTKSDLNEETIFYTECCLFITLVTYIFAKFAKLEETNFIEPSSHYSSQLNDCKVIKTQRNEQSTQTDIECPQIKEISLLKAAVDEFEVGLKNDSSISAAQTKTRTLEECVKIMHNTSRQLMDTLTDEECASLVRAKYVPFYKLESHFSDPIRAIELRRHIVTEKLPENSTDCFAKLPFQGYDYNKVSGSCCENVIGYVPVPLGLAGPLKIDGKLYYIPMATTEGTLVASTNRGCTALSVCLFFFNFKLNLCLPFTLIV